jgi:shikimate dehydrogenase
MPDNPAPATVPTIRGTTAVMFIVADPVAQVKAPEALNLIFSSAGIDAVMVPVRIGAPHLRDFIAVGLRAGNVRGTLVSIPHKTALVEQLDRLDDDARSAGAVNAIRRAADGSLEGAQFDGVGFVDALRHHAIAIAGQRVLLLGAGGAGLAIASALGRCSDRVGRLAIHDTDPARASALANRLAKAGVPAVVAGNSDPAGHDLIVNATPLGLRADDPLPLDVDRLQAGQAVVDILMKNDPTPLERACTDRGVAVFSGHEMMVQQVPAYLEFFGYPELADRLRRPGDPMLADVRQLLRGSRTKA